MKYKNKRNINLDSSRLFTY